MVQDVAEFLRRQAPFDVLVEEELAALAATAEIEFHPAGELVIAGGSAPGEHVWVVRSGAVELLDGERVLDLLGEGEMLGHPAMLSGMPVGLRARASEDTLCYRLPVTALAPVLTRAGSGISTGERARRRGAVEVVGVRAPRPGAGSAPDASHRPARELVRREPVVCAPHVTIRDAARRMTVGGQSSVVVRGPGGELGIVTDRDLRSRVATGEVPVDAPVGAVMTPRAFTVTPEAFGSEVLLDLLDRGVRHVPVVDASGTVLGVIEDLDLLATDTQAPFRLRRAIAGAGSVDELAAIAAAGLGEMAISLCDARIAPTVVSTILSTLRDALVRRLISLAIAGLAPAPAELSWLALGSMGRREALPSSDVDAGLIWHGDDGDPRMRRWAAELAAAVTGGLERCGLHADAHGVRADRPLFARSTDAWRAAVRRWIDVPGAEVELIAISVLSDGRVIWGPDEGRPVAPILEIDAGRRPGLLRLLARLAIAHRPPTGFRREIVVEHSGEHRGTFDVKQGGVLPIVDLARWAGMAAGATPTGTPERLAAAARAGVLPGDDATALAEAWELLVGMRLDHQVTQLRAGEPPDEHLDPRTLGPLSRRYMREAFRAVGTVQRRIAAELQAQQVFGTGR